MSSDWLSYKLADLATFKYGDFLAKTTLNDSGFPVFSGYKVVGYLPTYQYYDQQLLIVCRGEGGTGDVKMSPPTCSITNLSIVIFPNEEIVNQKFLYWALRASDTHRLRSGSAQAQIVIGALKLFTVNVPPKMVEQLNIAEILDTLDDRIALLRETNSTLEAIAQALFKSWFVDFDPVRAKQEGREPEGMDSNTAALFPDSFKESELGLVPKGWQILPLGEAVESVGGGTPNTKEVSFWEPAEFVWTTPKDLSGLQSPVLLKTERLLSAKGVLNVSSGLLPVGTLLLSSRAPIGYLAIAQIPLSINQGYIAMLPNSKLPPLYMLFWCKQNMEIIKSHSNGSTFMEISKKAFRPIKVLVPSVSVLNSYLDVVKPVFERLVENEKQVQTLTSIRDTLLPRLITGQLRLPVIEDISSESIK